MEYRKEGQAVPDVTFRTRVDGDWRDVSTKDLFGGKRVVVFSLPGAFTPTCSSAHVPRFNELAPAFKRHGIDDILCVSVNDAFVMDAWKQDQHADQVTFVPDGNGEFSRGMGLLVDKQDLGFGPRSWRYAMVVKDGVIEKMFVEPEKPGDPYEVSDADTVLKYVAPDAQPPKEIVVFSRPGCGHCARARKMLEEAALPYVDIEATPQVLLGVSGRRTTPQIFIDGRHIGGADDLQTHLRNPK